VEKVYAPILTAAGIETRIVDRDDEMIADPGVRLCTMHRAKGLEFEHVIIAGLGDARYPRPIDDGLAHDVLALRAHEAIHRSLLFVSATRARDGLHVSGWGARSPSMGMPDVRGILRL
jgi:superfamily I DNA/RNA helicase